MTEEKDLISDVLNNDLRVVISFLLMIYPRLNITQISEFVGKSKATISRHMKVLEKAGIVNIIAESEKGQGNPKFFELNQQKIEEFNFSRIKLPSKILERKEIYGSVLNRLSTILLFFQKAMEFIVPLNEALRPLLVEDTFNESTDAEFLKYLFRDEMNKMNFQYLFFDEDKLQEFMEIYDDFRKKINALVTGDRENAMLFLDMTLPIKNLIDLQISKIKNPKGK
ncbi:MAG: winged helix-turn-helix domain-containing protein [Candidatus Hodarchaeota archaeon]